MDEVRTCNPKRILHIVQRMEAGGIQSFLMNLYRQLDRDLIQFDFLVHYTEKQFYDDEILALGGKIYRLTFREDKNFFKYLRDLQKFFNEHKEYEIIHGHMDSLGLFYLKMAEQAGIPMRIAHSHTVIRPENFKKKLRSIFNRKFKTHANILCACSKEAGVYMFEDSPFHILKNPVDINRFSYNPMVREKVRHQYGLEKKFVVGNVGRLTEAKNQKFVLDVTYEILKQKKNLMCLIVGEGELQTQLYQYAKDLGIDSYVKFVKPVKNIEDFYQAMDCFLMPSLYEGLGIVAIEAQISGLPVVCSDRVPESACVTDISISIPLENSKKQWADQVLEMCKDYVRQGYEKQMRDSGYDVKDVMQELLEIYGVNIK